MYDEENKSSQLQNQLKEIQIVLKHIKNQRNHNRANVHLKNEIFHTFSIIYTWCRCRIRCRILFTAPAPWAQKNTAPTGTGTATLVWYWYTCIFKVYLLTSRGHWWRPKLRSEWFFLKISIIFGISIPKNLWFDIHMSIFCLFKSDL